MRVKPQSKPYRCTGIFKLLYLEGTINKTLKKMYAILLQFPFYPTLISKPFEIYYVQLNSLPSCSLKLTRTEFSLCYAWPYT